MSVKNNLKNVDAWIGGLFILGFGIVLCIPAGLLGLLVIIQFITKVCTGEVNRRLLQFSEGLSRYIYQILQYITFASEQRPFPLSDWPESEEAPAVSKKAAGGKASKAKAKKTPPKSDPEKQE